MTSVRTRGLASLVAAGLVVIPIAPAKAAAVARAAVEARVAVVVAAPTATSAAAPAAVVGLEADDPALGAALTRALRRAFAARGLSGGKDANLSELRLALGCKTNAPECLSRGGELLGARRLIYGTLHRAEGGGWTLEAAVLEVETGVANSVSLSLTDADVEGPWIDATAETIADRLAPDTAVSASPERGAAGLATPPPPPEPQAHPSEDEEPDADADVVQARRFGWVKPQPTWKLVGLGVSAGVFVGGLAGYLGTSIWLTSKDGGFRKRLLDAAAASLTDDNPLNDIDPNLPSGINLCEYARQRPVDENGVELGQPGQVRNSSVTAVCFDGETVKKRSTVLGVVGLVGLVSTVTFTLLLLVHPKPATAKARTWRRHGLYVDLEPARGLSLRLGGRF